MRYLEEVATGNVETLGQTLYVLVCGKLHKETLELADAILSARGPAFAQKVSLWAALLCLGVDPS